MIELPFWKPYSFLSGFGFRDVPIHQYLPDAFIPETKQNHGLAVHYVDQDVAGPLEGDAFITNRKGIACWIRTADCVPVLIFDPVQNACGAVHAGWKGTAKKIVSRTVEEMKRLFGSSADNLEAAIGPSICPRCFLVRDDVVRVMIDAKLYPGPWYKKVNHEQGSLDLPGLNFHLLQEAGLQKGRIHLSHVCTLEDKRFASYRREGIKRGEQVSFICL